MKITSVVAAILCLLPFLNTQSSSAQAMRYVVADQDTSGPDGSAMRSLMMLLNAPDVRVLGITVVAGDEALDIEVNHALRLLESLNRTEVSVYPGAATPLVRTREWTDLASAMYGDVTYKGAWAKSTLNGDSQSRVRLPEGLPKRTADMEDAAHFMIRMVHEYPHEVTIFAGGPLTNVALAVRLDPQFAKLARELVVMGGSLTPQTEAAEWTTNPRHEFNFWFDPEAASITLNAEWPKVSVTTIDATLETHMTAEILQGLQKSRSLAAQYVLRYTKPPGDVDYLWDELAVAAWIDPTLIKTERFVYMDVNIAHDAAYGDTLIWSDRVKPTIPHQKVHAQTSVDVPRLNRLLIELLRSDR
jgi:purine nucleosidase